MHGCGAGSGAPKGNTNARKDAVSAHERLIAKHGRPSMDLKCMDWGDDGLGALFGDPGSRPAASALDESMVGDDRSFQQHMTVLEAELLELAAVKGARAGGAKRESAGIGRKASGKGKTQR